MASPPRSTSVSDILQRPYIFVSGKGGVGKTAVSQAIAQGLARQGKRVLWVTFEDPTRPPGELKAVEDRLWHLNCDATLAFEEYIGLKLKISTLTKVFLQNKLMRYMAKASPGIHEIVLLGKVWHDIKDYDHIVADMPSTGYGLAMFKSIENFAKLFTGGPVQRDAQAMLDTFGDPDETGQLIVALPEEMPLRESLELFDYLLELFPDNPAGFIANRIFPTTAHAEPMPRGSGSAHANDLPIASSATEYVLRRGSLERTNLSIWSEAGISFGQLRYQSPEDVRTSQDLVQRLSEELRQEGYL